jgi:hypothetical protein
MLGLLRKLPAAGVKASTAAVTPRLTPRCSISMGSGPLTALTRFWRDPKYRSVVVMEAWRSQALNEAPNPPQHFDDTHEVH